VGGRASSRFTSKAVSRGTTSARRASRFGSADALPSTTTTAVDVI